jgi:hypothetical protein
MKGQRAIRGQRAVKEINGPKREYRPVERGSGL